MIIPDCSRLNDFNTILAERLIYYLVSTPAHEENTSYLCIYGSFLHSEVTKTGFSYLCNYGGLTAKMQIKILPVVDLLGCRGVL